MAPVQTNKQNLIYYALFKQFRGVTIKPLEGLKGIATQKQDIYGNVVKK